MTSASRASYSPESRVRTSSSSIALCSAVELGLGLGAGVLVVLGLGQLDQHGEVVEAAAQVLDAGDLALHVATAAR